MSEYGRCCGQLCQYGPRYILNLSIFSFSRSHEPLHTVWILPVCVSVGGCLETSSNLPPISHMMSSTTHTGGGGKALHANISKQLARWPMGCVFGHQDLHDGNPMHSCGDTYVPISGLYTRFPTAIWPACIVFARPCINRD